MTSASAQPTTMTVLSIAWPSFSSTHASTKLSNDQLLGSASGEPEMISRFDLNADRNTHSSGSTTTSDQIPSTTCEVTVTARSPPEPGPVLPRPARPARGSTRSSTMFDPAISCSSWFRR